MILGDFVLRRDVLKIIFKFKLLLYIIYYRLQVR